VPADVIEEVWKDLAATAPRELARRRDRYMNVQPDLYAWLDDVPLPEAGALAATDLVFELWAMFDQAFGERLDAVAWKALGARWKEPPPPEATQPALAAYVAEALDTLAVEDQAFDEAARAQVERVAATVIATLADTLREPS